VTEPPVLIIVVTYNKKDYVLNLLQSLKQIAYKNYDIVVVDNASNDGTVPALKEKFPEVHVIESPENTGGSGGFNLGLEYAFKQTEYKYYWLLDNDVLVSKDSLKNLVDVLESDDSIAVAGSQMCQLDNPEVTNEIGAYVDLHYGGLVLNRHLTRRSNNKRGIYDVDYVAAASLVVRADVAKKAGLWEDFFIHFDDVDWCLRIRKMGCRVVAVADSVIWHLSAAEKPITWQYFYDVRNMLYLLRKHATAKDVRRFLIRKCMQAVHTEIMGFAPVAEIILDAIEDFREGRKGKKVFAFPENSEAEKIIASHPSERVLIVQNEWFDLKEFPLTPEYESTIEDIMLPPYLVDSYWYWNRLNRYPVINRRSIKKYLMMLSGLMGFRKYKRAYVDIRYMPYSASLLSDELAVKINDVYWLIDRRPFTVCKNLLKVGVRSIKNIVAAFFMK